MLQFLFIFICIFFFFFQKTDFYKIVFFFVNANPLIISMRKEFSLINRLIITKLNKDFPFDTKEKKMKNQFFPSF